ncbi:type ISP restriction/modification enzyme [Tsukamurella sp. DT100]|uniref:type ISP restriction/modification enzyme n=1 Tax=Tsukamurella sp. DT100 TaxID=3393415 RepID=UPI003CEB8E75
MDAKGFATVVSEFGARTKSKLSATISGEPEEQLRAPIEHLLEDMAAVVGLDPKHLVVVGETSLSDLKSRPDFAVTDQNVLVGFVEVKAPGKGADPRRFKGHDKQQWERLKALPNLIYTDGNAFSLWHDGELAGKIIHLDGDVESSGAALAAPESLRGLFHDFFRWEPTPPRRVTELATLSARLCRLLRDEVREQLAAGDSDLEALAQDWRKMLFPTADDAEVADGYAQTVTFGLLLARSRGIDLDDGLYKAAVELGHVHSLVGTALRVLTDPAVADVALRTSVKTMQRVLNVVDWSAVTKGDANAWLYFYENFLQEYDPALRRKTGSYYTPVEVVESMTRLVDDALAQRFGISQGLADKGVTVLDPAVGTGTFPIAVLERIAARVVQDQGPGAKGAAITAALNRLIGFELQLGPFAVAQLRVLAELAELGSDASPTSLRMYVADTLANPYIEQQELGAVYEPIAKSKREADKIKASESIFVVLGNPPYDNRAKGRGGWIESGNPAVGQVPPLDDFIPPRDWEVGRHTKHLRDMYVYFWRWATWKVFDSGDEDTGIVCFITLAGFLDGPGFQRMREYLRHRCDHLWVIDASPEGQQPPVNTRIFQDVQQPVCIVLAARTKAKDDAEPAAVHYRELPAGDRTVKFDALAELTLDDGWDDGATGWRDPFRPKVGGAWATFVPLDQIFWWNGSGVMPGRTWVIAPDAKNLTDRWGALKKASPLDRQRELFSEHEDRRIDGAQRDGLPGFPARTTSVLADTGACPPPIRYGFRSFDRQWIIPDKRLINRPNPTLWKVRSDQQVYMTAFERVVPGTGPAVTFSGLVPDLDHFRGNHGGRAFPLLADGVTVPNTAPGLLSLLTARYGFAVSGPDLMAYLACLLAHPGFLIRVKDEFSSPGIRVPLTGSGELFARCVELGRRVIWLHTYGTRFTDPAAGRPASAPRIAAGQAPSVVAAIPSDPDSMPNELGYHAAQEELRVGYGRVANVTEGMWDYQVSGVNVLHKWFSYRKHDRERPVIGDRRVSDLMKIQTDHWLADYTSELIDLLNVLGLLCELEPQQDALLAEVVVGPLIEWAALEQSLGNPTAGNRTPPTSESVADEGDTLF